MDAQIFERVRGARTYAAATDFASEKAAQREIRNGHVDKRPVFKTAATVVNIGDNKRSLNQIVVVVAPLRTDAFVSAVRACARTRFDDDDNDDGYFVTLA